MNIGILSRGPQLYSTQSLWRAGQRKGHQVYVIDHTRCSLLLDHDRPMVYFENKPLHYLHAVIPRIGASVTDLGASVIRHFELMGLPTTARSEALLQSRDKLYCLQRLSQAGIPIPRTIAVSQADQLPWCAEQLGGLPIVIKLLESTHGEGVLLADNLPQGKATLEALLHLGERVILQEFIAEAEGADVRAFVVANEVVASMLRKAQPGEFRSNLHRGATATPIQLTEEELALVKETVAIMGLEVAGVDLLRSNRGPLVMEVNASPGLEGIETITKVDIAARIIRMVEKKVRKPYPINR